MMSDQPEQNRSIAFIANSSQFLPEIDAYKKLFESIGWAVKIFRYIPNSKELFPFRVEWHIMGTDFSPKNPKRIKIHEYCSASFPPFPHTKNFIKRMINVEPDYRVYQNQWMVNQMKMTNKPFFIRDMGINEQFFLKEPVKKEFDFVYAGSIDKNRNLRLLVDAFHNNFPNHSILIVGNIPIWLKKMESEQIVLINSVPYTKIHNWIKKARYGINYVPDVYPFYRQTSTKLLEYCAAGLKIITTSYHWVNDFEKQKGGHFYKIDEKGINFHPQNIEKFQYATPDVHSETWEKKFSTPEFKELLYWLSSPDI